MAIYKKTMHSITSETWLTLLILMKRGTRPQRRNICNVSAAIKCIEQIANSIVEICLMYRIQREKFLLQRSYYEQVKIYFFEMPRLCRITKRGDIMSYRWLHSLEIQIRVLTKDPTVQVPNAVCKASIPERISLGKGTGPWTPQKHAMQWRVCAYS